MHIKKKNKTQQTRKQLWHFHAVLLGTQISGRHTSQYSNSTFRNLRKLLRTCNQDLALKKKKRFSFKSSHLSIVLNTTKTFKAT